MNNRIKVSVVLPVFQVEKYIEDCLDSVCAQSLTDLEIICVDDCGTDGSMDIVRRRAASDKRIRIVRNERNEGLAASRNHGLDLARGTYVYFLDSDDKITPDAMEELLRLSEDERLDAVVFCADFIYENAELEEKFRTNPAVFKGSYPDILTGKELYVRWMEKWDWMPSQPRFFYRREFLDSQGIRFPEGVLHEDEIFAFDVLMKARRIRVRNDRWFIRRFRAGSIMTAKPTLKNVSGCVRILQHISAAREEYVHDPALSDAVDFYRKKIAANALGKYSAAVGVSREEAAETFHEGAGSPCVSVLIPVYNVRPYLEQCLTSVLAQTLTDLEIICVDDASTDGSPDLLRHFREMDPRIRVLENERNLGQAAARNRALDVASGQYVYMLDADDWIRQDALELLYDLCERDALDLAGFENSQFTEDAAFEEQARTVLFSYKKTAGLYTGGDAFVKCVEEDTLSPSVPTFFISRPFLEKTGIRFTEGILHEDIGFIFELLTRADRVELLHEQLFFRRFRAHSTVTAGFTARHAEGYLKSWQKAMELKPLLLEKYGDRPAFWRAWRKWQRDVGGRIRMLYMLSETDAETAGSCEKQSGTADGPSELLLEWLKMTTPSRKRTEDILEEETCRELEASGAVYVCGSGQYANRFLDLAGGLDLEIRGILEINGAAGGKRAMRGFPLLAPDAVTDREIPVVMAVSHYRLEEYTAKLDELGFVKLLRIRF